MRLEIDAKNCMTTLQQLDEITVENGIVAEDQFLDIDCHRLLSYCRQAACGLEHLTLLGLIHRDVAASESLIVELLVNDKNKKRATFKVRLHLFCPTTEILVL